MQLKLSRLSGIFSRNISVFLIFCLTDFSACKKSGVSEFSKLPAPTQIGANTFGCLVNGKAFLPSSGGYSSPPKLAADYSPSPTGGLTIYARNKSDNGVYTLVSLKTDSLSVEEGQTLHLSTRAPGNAVGFFSAGGNYMTGQGATGTLTITKLDLVNKIISGSFDFEAKDTAGNLVKITDGRFDVHFPISE